jgi:serine/threonine protein kinase
VQHPNIVTVHEVTQIMHPTSGVSVPTVVMELVEGTSLTQRIGDPIERDELRRIGDALLDAIEAYHANNLAHLDLHDHNVIVGRSQVKVLDAIYFETAALSSTATRTTQQAKDIRSVRDVIEQMLYARGVSTDVAASFIHATARRDLTLASLRAAFHVAVPPLNQRATPPPLAVEFDGSVTIGNCDEKGERCTASNLPDALHVVRIEATHRQVNVCKQCLDEAVSTARWQIRK